MRLKRALAGLLSAALVLGAPGLPCWEASAQVVRGKVAGVPYKTGLAPLNRAPGAFAPASFKAFQLAPNVSLAKSLLLPPSAVTGSALQVLETPTANQVPSAVFQTLQTLGAELTKEGGSPSLTLDASFDGSLKKQEAPVDIRRTADIPKRARLGKRAVLAASATLLAVPGFSQTARAASERASLGPVAIGLAVLGLGLFLYNRVQARRGSKQRRALDTEHAAFQSALTAREALQRRLQGAPGAVVTVERVNARPYELVVMFSDRASLEATALPETFQGLTVRKEALGATGGANWRLNGWVAAAGLALGASAPAHAQAATEGNSSALPIVAMVMGGLVLLGNLGVWAWNAVRDRAKKRLLERQLALFRPAMAARARLMGRLDVLGARYDWVGAVWRGDRYELGVFFSDEDALARAPVPGTFEGYAVSKIPASGPMAKLMRGPGSRLSGWLGPLLAAALTLGAPLAARAASQASAAADAGPHFLAAALVGFWGYSLLGKSAAWCWVLALTVLWGIFPWYVALLFLLAMPGRKDKK